MVLIFIAGSLKSYFTCAHPSRHPWILDGGLLEISALLTMMRPGICSFIYGGLLVELYVCSHAV